MCWKMTKMNRRTCQLLVLLLWGISDILQFPRKLPGFFFFYQISYSKTETEGLLSVTGIQTQSSPTLLLPNPVLEDCQTSERHKVFSIFIFSQNISSQKTEFYLRHKIFLPFPNALLCQQKVLKVQMCERVFAFQETMGSFPMSTLFYAKTFMKQVFI